MAARLIPFKSGQVVADIPAMKDQWDYEKNPGVDITKLSVTTKKPAYFWTCKKCGFTWKSSVEARLYSTGECPCCERNRYIVPGINDLLTVHSEAAAMLDFEANAAMGIQIETLSPSRQKVQVAWHCRKCGYKWTTTVKSMGNSGFRCPCCETRKVIVKGISDVFTLVPGLKDYYDFEKNGDFDIYSEGVSSTKKVRWLCPVCKRSWESSICSRIKGKEGKYEVKECPHYNTVKRTNVRSIGETPEMFKFWDHDQNTLDPASTPTNSPLIAFWKCQNCKHEWKSIISVREQSSHKCPSCELNQRIVEGVNDLFTLIPEAKVDYDFDKNIGINIENQGVRSDVPVWWKCHVCGHEWQSEIRTRVRGKQGSYSLSDCAQCYHEKQRNAKKVAEYPYLVKFWNFDKNKELGLAPNLASSNSEQTAHWRCKRCGYEWEGQIKARKRLNSDKCPCCDQNVRIKAGVNDIFTIVPELKRIYNFDLNKDIDITSEGVGSTRCVNFKCPTCGKRWTAPINGSVRKQSDGNYRVIGCPDCDNRKYRKISYAEQYPDLADRFDNEKNGFLFSELDGKKNASTRAYWWVCDTCERSFEAGIHRMLAARATRTKGCPYCAKAVMVPGESFAERFPEHMDEYSPANEIDPHNVYPTSKKYVEWICRNDSSHVWPSSFYQRSKGEGKCPICNRTRYIKGYNTLEDKYPELVPWWSPSNEKSPDKVFHNTVTWYKWICPECNEEFSATIQKMASTKERCPFCTDLKVLPGVNSFAVEYPDAARHWSPNNKKTPDQVLHSIKSSRLWICPTCKGEFSAPAHEMAYGTASCPYCDNRQLLPGFNSLAARYPEIAKKWSSKNEKTADEHLFNSRTYAIWDCPDCHGEYNALIDEIVAGTYDCPYCNNRRVLPGFNSFAVRHEDLLKEWDFINNYLLADPDQISESFATPVWWKCLNDSSHKYHMSPADRLMFQKRHREPCAYCKGLRRKKRHFV